MSKIARLILACAALVHAANAIAGEKQQPNVLFIAVDDLRVELGCYGNTPAQTPNIDRLAQRGTMFRRTYCQQSLCNPSRASLLTGLRPDTLKVWDLPTHFRVGHPDIVTLPQLFKNSGYFTQDIGKIFHNYRQDDYKGDAPSWSVPQLLHYNTHYNDKPKIEGALPTDSATLEKTECRDVPDEAYFDGQIANLAVEALGQIQDKPFFLAVGFWKPHLPFNAPRKYWDLYDRDQVALPRHRKPPENCPPLALTNYRLNGDKRLSDDDIREARHGHLAAISYLDAQIGKVLDELDRLGLREQTIVVFWSDHGLHVGERGLWSKRTNFELDTRVPLIIASPAHNEGQAADGLVELLDLYPTLIDLCDLSPTHELEGVSLRPMLENPQATVKDVALSQHPRPNGPSGDSFAITPPEVMGYSIRTDRYRYTEWRGFTTGKIRAQELYDHHTDPLESKNVAALKSYADVALRLARLLDHTIDPHVP